MEGQHQARLEIDSENTNRAAWRRLVSNRPHTKLETMQMKKNDTVML